MTVVLWVAAFVLYFLFLEWCNNRAGLECLRCTHVEIDDKISQLLQGPLKQIANALTSPECTTAILPSVAGRITKDTCTDEPTEGRVNRCGTLSGTQQIASGVADIPVEVHTRGCFLVAQALQDGCNADKSLVDEQRVVLTNVFKSVDSSIKLGEMTGKLCLEVPNVPNVSPKMDNGSNKLRFSLWLINMAIVSIFLFK